MITISESWEREDKPLTDIINLEGFHIISNVHQRRGRGGRPAILASTKYFHVKDLKELITVPNGVEVVWAMLTPKYNIGPIKRIAVASIYSKPKSRKKTELLDHICESYNIIKAKYNDKSNFILAGDTNDLNLSRILDLHPNMRQTVTLPTRHNPDKILDPIITDLSTFYQTPVVKPPLEPVSYTHLTLPTKRIV